MATPFASFYFKMHNCVWMLQKSAFLKYEITNKHFPDSEGKSGTFPKLQSVNLGYCQRSSIIIEDMNDPEILIVLMKFLKFIMKC